MRRIQIALTLVLGLAAMPALAQTGYDVARETSISGVVNHVISATGPDGTVGVHLEVTTSTGLVKVHLGPAIFIGMNNFFVYADDKVAIRGSTVKKDGETAIWARVLVKNGEALTLRDDDGTPRWPRATAEDPDGCGVSHAPIR
jgi:hypothetical protein